MIAFFYFKIFSMKIIINIISRNLLYFQIYNSNQFIQINLFQINDILLCLLKLIVLTELSLMHSFSNNIHIHSFFLFFSTDAIQAFKWILLTIRVIIYFFPYSHSILIQIGLQYKYT